MCLMLNAAGAITGRKTFCLHRFHILFVFVLLFASSAVVRKKKDFLSCCMLCVLCIFARTAACRSSAHLHFVRRQLVISISYDSS